MKIKKITTTIKLTKEELDIFEKFIGRTIGKSFGDELPVILRVLEILNVIKNENKKYE